MYGGGLSIGALDLLSYCPIICLLFGYWMFGNRQIFFNETNELETSRDDGDPGHYIFNYSVSGKF